MSKVISDLLGADRRTLDSIVSRLEHITMRPGIDVKLTAEIITQSREKTRALGMDPSDTTEAELYHSLLAKAAADGEKLREKLGVNSKTKPVDAAAKIAKACEKLLKKDTVVAMHPTVVRKILKAVPPKKTMRALHFRSIDSVLKRENPLVLYALAKRLEDKTWNKQVHARIKRLQPRDASEQSPLVLSLPATWLSKLEKKDFDSVVESVPEIGAVLILPSMPMKVKGSVILTCSLVLQAGQRLAIESLPYRTRALSTGIEKLIPEIAAGFMEELDPVHGLSPSWHAVYQLLATQSKSRLPDFEFVLGDLQWESTETRLASLVPELDFWVNNHYLGYPHTPLPVSFHVVDVSASLVLKREFGEHITSHMRGSLWNEFQVRYLKHDSIEQAIVNQLSMAQELVI